ncbi:N-6 DNA methylase [Streptomyces sp. HNM0663]|uniref:N-6 DNA methylase n=1 Tax=Streptomyces chengmaiensis TaxID=3040919 RepID=A0ABT6HSF3_9ACTN|nr:N-6 DNA methylase [Streptomyces chengmaiensis]MDH2391626.1 N-6 DNA methylase [Streptomyces chengmaiensis]
MRPGGRIGMVLPNGILPNPGADDEALRQYILDQCRIMASVDLPVESLLVGAGVNVLTSARPALRKKTEQEKRQERMHGPPDYPVFMAAAEKVGHDRRGKPLYVRDGHGNLVASGHEETDLVTVRGVANLRSVRRRAFILDDDLRSARQFPQGNDRPCIIAAYDEFVARHGHEFPWNSGD